MAQNLSFNDTRVTGLAKRESIIKAPFLGAGKSISIRDIREILGLAEAGEKTLRITHAAFGVLALSAVGLDAPAKGADVPVDLELVLAVDVSASVDPFEARLQRKGYVDAMLDSDIIGAIQRGNHGRIAVTYVEWSGASNTRTVVPWAIVEDRASAFAFSTFVEAAPVGFGHWTSISGAINFSASLFSENGYRGIRRVIDLSADGPNNDGESPETARDEAVSSGIVVNGLPIVNKRPQASGEAQIANYGTYFRECIIGGPGAFMVVAKDFVSFAQAIRRKLLSEIAGILPRGGDVYFAERSPRRLLHPVTAHNSTFDCEAGTEKLRLQEPKQPNPL